MNPETVDGATEVEVRRRSGTIGLERIFVALQDIERSSLRWHPVYKWIEFELCRANEKERPVVRIANIEDSMEAIETHFNVKRRKLELTILP